MFNGSGAANDFNAIDLLGKFCFFFSPDYLGY
jgi:hypothetical protein